MRCARNFAIIFVVLLTLPAVPAQQQQPPMLPGQETQPGPPSDMQKRMEKEANKQRHADLKRDTDKLLKLSTELKEYVDKTNENILSLDVVRKADEIEKLAHSVKTKMRAENFAPPVTSTQP